MSVKDRILGSSKEIMYAFSGISLLGSRFLALIALTVTQLVENSNQFSML
jgi:hypothetical protein